MAKSERFVILNGEVVSAETASVPIDDRGFLYGDSVFTTLRCYDGVPFRLSQHCRRLEASLASPIVGIDYHVDEECLHESIRRLIELNGCRDTVARFMITRGRGAGPVAPNQGQPTTLLTVGPIAVAPSLYREGVQLIISSVRRDRTGELGKHKLGSYVSCLLARRQAVAQGAYEGVLCDTDGNLLECACSNLFVVTDGVVITPDVTENLLPGITREAVLECARREEIGVSLKTLTPSLVEQAEECFITNSVIEIVPVRRLGSIEYGLIGGVTSRLMAAYSRLVRQEIGEAVA